MHLQKALIAPVYLHHAGVFVDANRTKPPSTHWLSERAIRVHTMRPNHTDSLGGSLHYAVMWIELHRVIDKIQ
jgi:hypothetical protein